MTDPQNARLGRHVPVQDGAKSLNAFIPNPLPPPDPIKLRENSLVDAASALGHLDHASASFAANDPILNAYMLKEMVLSQQIKGWQTSYGDAVRHQAGDKRGNRTLMVLRGVDAIMHGWRALTDGQPLSNSLLQGVHAQLFKGTRKLVPGQFRQVQVTVGQYVPPPWKEVQGCMSSLEQFIGVKESNMPALVRAGLAHVQFEKIHPFPDGNGRTGRILINLMLQYNGELQMPLLPLSLFFKRNLEDYQKLLREIHIKGNWDEWIDFFLMGVRDTAKETTGDIVRLSNLFRQTEKHIRRNASTNLGSLLDAHDALVQHTMISAPGVARIAKMTAPTAAAALEWLEQQGIVRALPSASGGLLYRYEEYYKILRAGT